MSPLHQHLVHIIRTMFYAHVHTHTCVRTNSNIAVLALLHRVVGMHLMYMGKEWNSFALLEVCSRACMHIMVIRRTFLPPPFNYSPFKIPWNV